MCLVERQGGRQYSWCTEQQQQTGKENKILNLQFVIFQRFRGWLQQLYEIIWPEFVLSSKVTYVKDQIFEIIEKFLWWTLSHKGALLDRQPSPDFSEKVLKHPQRQIFLPATRGNLAERQSDLDRQVTRIAKMHNPQKYRIGQYSKFKEQKKRN